MKRGLFFIIGMFYASNTYAEPITALITAISAGLSSFGTAVAATGLISFSSIGAFLLSPIGGLIVGLGLQLVVGAFTKNGGGRSAPSIENGKINVRVGEPERWLCAGEVRQGGGVVFGEYDSNGYFWYVIVHADSYHTGILKRYFDDTEITIDGNNDVITDDFCLDTSNNLYSGSGTKVPYFRIWTATHDISDPTPPQITELKTAFPGESGWTDGHLLVGTTYSVIRIKPIAPEHRYKIMRWRGPIGLGEPGVGIVAQWSEPYNPATETYAYTRNPVLIAAWFRMHRYGRNKSFDSINWDKIEEQAAICNETVVGISGSQPCYECGIAIPESKERSQAEQEILASCDGQMVFDDDGKWWVRVGKHQAPSLTLYRNRDIIAMESVSAQNGESLTDGVIVRYIDKTAKYTAQPSAPWINPFYYVEGQTPKYLVIDILSCQNHNQAMRLAKTIGLRSQPPYKLAPTTGLRGIKARQERIIDIEYDNEFAGNHEIVTSVDIDQNGIFCGFGAVPVDENRWTLLEGEENSKPVVAIVTDSSAPVLPSGVTISYDGSKLIVTFDAISRQDHRYIFEYKLSTDSDDKYLFFSVDMENNIAISGGVLSLKIYDIRYKTVTSSGRSTAYISPIPQISTTLITVSGTPVTTGQVSVAYGGFTVSASGGTGPYIFTDLYGRLPDGITIDPYSGVVSGTPTVDGTFSNIIIKATDFNGAYNYLATFTITIDP